jgi:hypothetical protein
MSQVVVDISVSLDGYVTGPNVGPEAISTPAAQHLTYRVVKEK